MAREPAGTAVSGARPEMPSLAAEILIVLEPDQVVDDTAADSLRVTAARHHRRGWVSKLWTRRSQRSE